MFADWLKSVGLASAKPYVVAIVLPPVPLIVLALVGAWLLARKRRGGWVAVVPACVGLWLAGCDGFALWIERAVLHAPPALDADSRAALRARAARQRDLAIVVLGGGVVPRAPEYGGADSLGTASLERLRYGLWLGRDTGIPVAMSGGLGWIQLDSHAAGEATIGQRIARDEFGAALRWQESGSRDTRENAQHTVALLAPAGVHEMVVVTHGWHMTRALREFRAAAAGVPGGISLLAAPIDTAPQFDRAGFEWTPTGEGGLRVRQAVRECWALIFAPPP